MASPEHERFSAIVETHRDLVFRTLARLVGRREQLEDLAQEVFLRLWRALPQFRGDAQLSTYIYRIAVNVAQEEWKRRRRREAEMSLSDPATGWQHRLAQTGPSVTDELLAGSLMSEIEEALMDLDAAERACLVLFHQEDRSYQEVAAILGLPLNTVRTHLYRGRARLKDLVRARMGEKQP